MAARTGEQFLRGLAGGREIWVGSDKISSPAEHPALRGAAQALAEVFDLQHQRAEACLMPDPETGEPINVSHMIPHSREDLQRRHRGLEHIAEYSVGLMGRTPDYMNVTFAGFAGRADEWAANGNEEGAENLVRYQKKLRREDLSLTTPSSTRLSIWQRAAARRRDPSASQGERPTEHGIVVKRVLTTLAPFADEPRRRAIQRSMPGYSRRCACRSHTDRRATPGLKFIAAGGLRSIQASAHVLSRGRRAGSL